MFYTTLALVMTVLMGGIIAYNGDLIGRKYGKKRVTLFGLRPKHTAILITSVTGVFISGLTTGVLFLLVPQVRRVILDGEQAIRDNIYYKRSNQTFQAQNAALLKQRSDNQAQLALQAGEIEATKAELKKQRGQLVAVTEKLRIAQTQTRQAERSLRILT